MSELDENESQNRDASLFYPEHKEAFLKALESLKDKRVAVLGHLRPDGDCIGSQVALCRVLRAIGVAAVAVKVSPIPRILQKFVGDTPFVTEKSLEDSSNYVAVTVDCADPGRIGKELQEQFTNIFLNVDHHISNPSYAVENFVIPDSSATGEILAGLFLDNELPLDAVTAQALYVAIATDTGQFRFGSTTAQVFEICQRLCRYGADPAAASLELYEQASFNKLKLLQRFLNTLELRFGGRVCIGKLEAGAYEETGAELEDSEGLVDYARAIAGVDIGVLLEERNGSLKGSLRAKNPVYRVDRIAEIFGGGGHACAAGLNIEEDWETFYPRLLKALEDCLSAVENET